MYKFALSLAVSLLFSQCFLPPKPATLETRIAFGSCGNQDRPQPILEVARAHNPDYFLFLGDNIYGDTDVMDTLKAKYGRWAAKPEFQHLWNSTKVLATWDDHDYGRNDCGRHYPFKEASKEIFLDFFKEPKDSPRRSRPGIYTAEMVSVGDKKIQIILLDNRTFRDDLLLFEKGKTYDLPRKKYFYDLDYVPHTSPDSTFLGAAQWQWLEQELSKPADIRLIGAGSQFGIEFNGYEAWANFPQEQARMLELIKKTRANGVIFLSGDVHYAEISRLKKEGIYPIYDVTASGITSTWDFATPNCNRIEGPVMENHFGLLTIDWKPDPEIKMEIIDVADNSRIEYTVKASSLRF